MGGKFHRGFATALKPLWKELEADVREVAPSAVFTGHSLGGAMATLAATLVRPDSPITFGSPRVGDEDRRVITSPADEVVSRVRRSASLATR